MKKENTVTSVSAVPLTFFFKLQTASLVMRLGTVARDGLKSLFIFIFGLKARTTHSIDLLFGGGVEIDFCCLPQVFRFKAQKSIGLHAGPFRLSSPDLFLPPFSKREY